ncbi:hypothetical protein VTJ04DRAFT_5665 [Mycothermus thermophilus]|uniref:uncharacterized protein n=1 Tax=Humicola insolens TaxID=85995 RepID=UPI003742068E
MAEPAPPKTDGNHAVNEDPAPQQSTSLPENATAEQTTETQTQNTPGDAAQSSAPPAGTEPSSTQAGDKDSQPAPAIASQPAEAFNAADNSLSIEPTGAPPPAADAAEISAPAPVCAITLLLPTGARHPYRIDEKYLTKRGVDIPDVNEAGWKDPFSISVYKLKELILREWREEWDGKPASPSSIRLIHFGKLLDDKEQLKKYHFSQDSPNVVHMSVKPPEMMEEDETAKGKSSSREARNGEGGICCCVVL